MQINLTPDPSLLAIMVIFILNYLIVRRFFLQPVSRVMEEREQDTRSAEERYEQELGRFNEATARMEAQLHAAKRAAAQVREQHRAEAATHRNAVVAQTHEKAQQIVGESEEKLRSDVTTARESIVRDSEALARLAAERILGRAV